MGPKPRTLKGCPYKSGGLLMHRRAMREAKLGRRDRLGLVVLRKS